MKFLIDAQLPPKLAVWINQRPGHSAIHVSGIEALKSDDSGIFFYARKNGYHIISKDNDFPDLVAFHGMPPQILFVICGNVSNEDLIAIFHRNFNAAIELLSGEMPVVEIG